MAETMAAEAKYAGMMGVFQELVDRPRATTNPMYVTYPMATGSRQAASVLYTLVMPRNRKIMYALANSG
jgi:hypothetical protein